MEFDSSFFDAGLERRHTDCEKWDGMVDEYHDPEMIPMWVADMDFRSAPAIADAVKRVAEQGTWGYTLSGEQDARALCDYWKRRHGVGFEPKDVQMGPCVVSELRLCVRALTEPGDGVLIFTPVYGPFYASITESGRRVVGSAMLRDEHGRYTLNLADAEGKLAAREAKMVMFCSPHNPCGRAWTEEELAGVVNLCYKYGVPLVCDEIHADFVYAPNAHHSILNLPHADELAVMLCAASKTFNVAGLQQASLVCKNERMREARRRIQTRRETATCCLALLRLYGLRRMAGRAEGVSGRQPRLCDGLREGAFPEGDRHAAGGDLPDVAGLPRAGA
ncbi:MAG: MalY/PatB family protein [Christensenellales bacterium]